MTSNEPPPYPGDIGPTSGLPSYGSVQPPAGSYPPPPDWGGFQPPVGGSIPFSATDAIGYGWRKFKDNVGPVLLSMLVLFVVEIALSVIGSGGFSMDTTGLHFSAVGLVWQILTTIIGYIIGGAVIRASLDVTEGKKFNLLDAVRRVPYAQVVIVSLLATILELIGLIALIVGAFIVAWFLVFATYFVVDKAQQPIEAIKSSVSLVGANVGNTIVLFLLSIAVGLLGAVACGVGLLVAIPVIVFAWSYAYKSFLGESVAP